MLKNEIRELSAKAKYGTAYEKVQELQNINQNLKNELQVAKDKVSTIIQPVATMATNTIKKIRK